MNVYENAFTLAFQKSPILLVDGLAGSIPGGVLPVAVFTEGASVAGGLLTGKGIAMASLTTSFEPAPGGTLVVNEVGTYPFLNQATAANAVIKKPNRITLHMTRPATTTNGGYLSKPVTFSALKMALEKHTDMGGSYTVLTPACVYTGCILRTLVDISGFNEQVKQTQYKWAFEFEQPLISASQLDAQLGNLMSKFSGGIPSPSGLSWSGAWQAAKDVVSGVFG